MKKLILSLLLAFVFNAAFTQTVYVTKTGKKYHTEDCRYLSRSSITISLADAKDKGYDACSICAPVTIIQKRSATVEASDQPVKYATSVQCSGTTKKGVRCQRPTRSANGRCWQHGG